MRREELPPRLSANGMTADSDRVRPRFTPLLQAAAVLLVCLLAFLSTPLSKLGHSYYSSADLSQDTELARSRSSNRPKNPLLSDPAVQMQPWLMFNRDVLATGEIPLWNDWNAAGAPHFANYQSAVFAPFSLPFYLLDFRWALLVAAFAKLFCLGLFTYLFFRAIELRQFPAIFGAVAFTFSGLNVLLLGYPHSAVAITLPAGLYCVEKAMRARTESQRSTRFVIGLGAVLACGLFGGHPEPFCFSLGLISAYVIARLGTSWSRQRADRVARKRFVALAGEFAIVGVLAAGLAAVQILPFLEYLVHSTVLATRSQGQPALEIANWPLWFFPDLLGNPSSRHVIAYELPHPNYEDVNTAYAGALVLWLAVVGAFVARSRRFWFFAACAALGVVYGYDLTGVGALAGRNLLMSAMPMNRSQLVVVFGLCACAALTVDRVAALPASARRRTVAIAASSAALLALVAWFGAQQLLAHTLSESASLTPVAALEAYIGRHYVWIASSFGVGALACLALPFVSTVLMRRVCGAVLLAAVFAASGFLLKEYNPTIDDDTFFPRTPLMQELQHAIGDRRLMILDDRCLPPDTNMPYGIRVASNYDALWVREFDTLYKGLFQSNDNWRTAKRATESGLKLCGIEYVLATAPWPAVDTSTEGGAEAAREVDGVNLGQRRTVRQTFVAEKDRLQAIELRVMHSATNAPRTLSVRLEDVSTGNTVAAGELELQLDTQPMPSGMVWRPVIFQFTPIESSRGRSYRLEVRADQGRARDALHLWALRKTSGTGEKYEIDERATNGRMWFNCSYNFDAFELVLRRSKYFVWRYKHSPSRYYCVDRAELAESDEAALRRLLAPEFDPAQSVVLSAPATVPAIEGSGGSGAEPATVITDEHARVRLRVERTTPGYLVITRAHYPGWRARVNGHDQPLLRANLGLSAIRVEAGTSEIEIEYDPQSFKAGLWCTALSAVGCAAWLAFAARRRAPRASSA